MAWQRRAFKSLLGATIINVKYLRAYVISVIIFVEI
jgi:hypothetical protein